MSKEIEEWRDIEGYEGLYQVSDWGRVKSLERIVHRPIKGDYSKKEHISNGWVNSSNKHIMIELQGKPYYVHQLVANAFVPNPNNNDVVHHIDFNPQNNAAENLIWMSDNDHRKLHGEIVRNTLSKKVYQYTLDGEFVKEWESVIEAARALEFNQGNISNCCNGGYYSKERGKWVNVKRYKGYKWSYEPL